MIGHNPKTPAEWELGVGLYYKPCRISMNKKIKRKTTLFLVPKDVWIFGDAA